ncbi:hypothetical protein VTP01DRAFT_6388 [Rhizomucor pusillus]|uniref:uncharacterized protein n=1 Tax=Rhizomucor pusillus TaxID=4840 RepID=UPI003743E0F9
MPPKRKSQTIDGAAKRSRVDKKKTSATTQRSKSSTNASTKARASQSDLVIEWFKRHCDPDDPEIISPEGCQAFFEEIQVPLDSIYPILIAWKMNANRMGYFAKEEWIHGMKDMNVDTPEKLRNILPTLERSLQDEQTFKKLYQFAFGYGKSPGQKSMDVDVAIAMWQVLLNNSRYPDILSFIEFLQTEKPVKVINKDQWSSLLDFFCSLPPDLSTYDHTSSWPVLFDDYVSWKTEKQTNMES